MATIDYVEAVIRQRAFSLVYQPILDLDTGTVSGVEALCRFHDGRPPDLWFEQCEAYGMTQAIDLAIIDLVVQKLDDIPGAYVAINLSPMSLHDPGPIAEALAGPTRARRIVVEITEHAVVQDYAPVLEGIARLRAMGVLLAVDDAGAGYASLQHILKLRPEIIKLDRSITASIDEDPARRALATAMVIFAGETGASVVAEGIETEGELEAVRSTGITRGQGYGLAMPSPLPLPTPSYHAVPYVDLRTPAVSPSSNGGAAGWPSDAETSVAAHALLGSLGSMSAAVSLLRATDGMLPPEQHRAVCGVLERQIAHVSGVLEDLVRGLPAEAVRSLDELSLGRG
jgi:EAL domain-containing protein (putative c-di-GMP-specific phosphodiesterase class I)